MNLLNILKVLIIGGGDGGIARECAKHPLVKSVTQCEIDGVSHMNIQYQLFILFHYVIFSNGFK